MEPSPARETPQATLARALKGDRLLQAGVIVWIVTLLPSFVSIFSPETTIVFVDGYADIPSLLVLGWALARAHSSSSSGRERTFWLLLAFSATDYLGVRALNMFGTPEFLESAAAVFTEDLLYVAATMAVVLALERRPDRAAVTGHRGQLRLLELVGALLFASGLITYFVFIPGVFHPEYYRSWGPSLLLFSVLDAYIVLRVVSILRGRVAPEWVRPYRWLGATYFTWFVADLFEGGITMGWVPGFDSGSPLDTLWHLPLLLLLLVVLSRGWPARTDEEQDSVDEATQRMDSLAPERSSLVAYALALPGIHFTLTLLGVQSDAILVHREILLLSIVLALAALLMLQQRVLRQLTHSIVADRRLVADQLHIAQRMEAVGRLASGVAHDFSNILSVIRGRAELLLMTGGAGDSTEDVNEIVEASRRGQALVTHLLTLGRRKSADAEVFDLSKVVGDLKPLLERVLPDSIDVRVISGDQGIPTVQADRAQLEQVVLNLVVNARDAMPSGGRLTLSTEIVQVEDHFAVVNGGARGGEYVMLRVADTGTGVPSELRHLVFEPFFTTKDEELGTGLGLSIVYGVAQQAHGFVRIDDAEGGGAIFEVYLPKATRQPSADRRRQRRAPTRGRETILLVEDYDSLRRTTARVLQETGYRVLEAGNAVEALAILDRRNERIELLLADIVLPDLSGFEVAERAVEQIPDLVTVFISGYPDGVTQMQRPESATVLEKPFSPEVLMFTVRRALDERKISTG